MYWHRMRYGFCSEIRIISQFKGQILCSYYIALVTPGSLVGFRARTYFNNKFCIDLEIMYSHRTCIVIRSKTPICLRLIRFSQVHLIVTCNWKWTDWLVPDHPKWVVCDFSKTWFSIYLKEKSRNCPCNNSKYFDFYYLALINHFFFYKKQLSSSHENSELTCITVFVGITTLCKLDCHRGN